MRLLLNLATKYRSGFLKPSHITFSKQCNRQVHPIFWPVVNFSVRITAAITGRRLRNKLYQMHPEERKKTLEAFVRRVFVPFGVLFTGYGAITMYRHRDKALFTGRIRTISIPHKQMVALSDKLQENILTNAEGHIFPTNSIVHKVIETAAKNVLVANRELEQVRTIPWRITVIHSNDVNAFVLPNGHIFVYTGILSEYIQNEHQLAFILAHEIAHVLLKHQAEKASKVQLKGALSAVVTFLLFMGLGDFSAFVVSFLYSTLYDLTFQQPYSRLMENEADEVGLMLIAKACYDIREACALWKLVSLKEQVEKFGGGEELQNIFSTHPSFDKRAKSIDALAPKALQLRMSRHCRPLSKIDPVESVDRLKKQLDQLGPIKSGSKLEILKDEVPGRKAIKLFTV